MLREVKNIHFEPRIVPVQATLSSTAASNVVNIGYGDYSLTREDTGSGTLTLKQPFTRGGLAFLSQSVEAAGYVTLSDALSAQSLQFVVYNKSGTETDGSVEGFMFGWDSSFTSFCKQQRVSCTQAAPRVIWGKVTGTTGAVAINARDFSCTRSAAGTYTVNFTSAFGKTPVVLVTGSGNTSTSVANRGQVTSKTAAGCIVTMAPESGTPTDGDFYIMAIGSDSRSDTAGRRKPLENSQRKPRIVAGSIDSDDGDSTISIGGDTGGIDLTTITDNATGDISFTIANTFAREPAIFLLATGATAEVHSYTAGVVRIKTKDEEGADANIEGSISVFIIGTDVNETF